MKLNYYQLISLAGLLHDVGKIKQRAELPIKNEFNWTYCPEDEHHKSKYVHAAHTADFLDWFIDRFKIETDEQENNLVNIAAYHHKRGDGGALEEIIKKADRLSSGFERESSDKSGKYKEDRLESIFSQVWLNKKPKTHYYPIKELSFDITPEEKPSSDNKKEYKRLYENFKNDLQKIKKDQQFDVFWDAVEHLYEKYTWAIPSSSFYSYPRISLFDHSKTTAAIAQALYGFHKSGNTLSAEKVRDVKENEFLLIQGDFSGIQNFIFSRMGESNKFAAKILRARSFFVSLATDLVAYEICRRLGLTKAAIIMNAGGKFTLLLPNTPESIETIYAIEKETNEWFEDITFGETRMVIAFVEASDKDFQSGAFSKKMEELVSKLEINKLQPKPTKIVFDDYLKNISANGVCKVCGKHPAREEGSTPICELCNKFKQWGEKLVSSDFFSIQGKKDGFLKWFDVSFKKDNNALLIFDLKNNDEFKGFAKTRISGYVPRVTKEDDDFGKYKDFEEYSGVGSIKTFAMIAEDAKTPNQKGEFVGEGFLGILKADIDNLGRIFIEGFKDNISISKIVSLSRMMDLFFTGWLQNIIKNEFKSVYTVFSGGDDLFLIGPFNQIVELARRINKHLKDYTKNDDIHISCGIYFAKDKIPVYQMAEESEFMLEKAKGKGKDRIGVFGRVVKWDEFEEMMSDEKIEYYLSEISNSFRYSLYQYVNSIERLNDKSKTARDLMWKPLFLYQVYRNVDKDLRADFIESFIEYFEKYGGDFYIPLSYYIYKNRRK